MTLTCGNFAWKLSTTFWMASASRSVKKCQNSIVPDAVTPGDAIWIGFADGVQPAAASAAVVRQAAARTPVRRRRIIETCSSRQRGWWGLSGEVVQIADEFLTDLGQRGVKSTEQDRVVRETGDRDLGIQWACTAGRGPNPVTQG